MLLLSNYVYTLEYITGLKPGRVIRVTFCAGQPGQIRIIKISGSDLNSALTALLEYFDLLAQALKSAELLPIFLSFTQR